MIKAGVLRTSLLSEGLRRRLHSPPSRLSACPPQPPHCPPDTQDSSPPLSLSQAFHSSAGTTTAQPDPKTSISKSLPSRNSWKSPLPVREQLNSHSSI